MLELEIQTLSQAREGLLIEVGRLVVASGFTVQRQRMVQGAHGILMTMVVHGPARKRRALETALEACQRIISFETAEFEEGVSRPHFAESRAQARPTQVPAATTAIIEPTRSVVPAASAASATARPVAPAEVSNAVEILPVAEPASAQMPAPEPEPEFIFLTPRPSPPAAAPVVEDPFVELIPLEADQAAVDKMLPKLTNHYPDVFSKLQGLADGVAEGARESTLFLAGQRLGCWVFDNDYVALGRLSLQDALERVAVPALGGMLEIERQGDQLHILNSPLCLDGGHSGCKFFSGYLDALIGLATGSDSVSIFPVCCRSYGAGECVLAISD